MEEDKKFEKPKPQQAFSKKPAKALVALKSGIVRLPGCDCEVHLVAGEEVHGLSRAERDHLKFHGFIA